MTPEQLRDTKLDQGLPLERIMQLGEIQGCWADDAASIFNDESTVNVYSSDGMMVRDAVQLKDVTDLVGEQNLRNYWIEPCEDDAWKGGLVL